jgi:hypothetical protein
MAVFKLGSTSIPLLAAATMGAEKSAPPGMGRRPIMAGMALPTNLTLRVNPVKLSTMRFNCPESFMRRLNTRIRATMSNNDSRLMLMMLQKIMEKSSPVGNLKRYPRATVPTSKATPRDSFNLFRVRIKPKARKTLIMAGISKDIFLKYVFLRITVKGKASGPGSGAIDNLQKDGIHISGQK